MVRDGGEEWPGESHAGYEGEKGVAFFLHGQIRIEGEERIGRLRIGVGGEPRMAGARRAASWSSRAGPAAARRP